MGCPLALGAVGAGWAAGESGSVPRASQSYPWFWNGKGVRTANGFVSLTTAAGCHAQRHVGKRMKHPNRTGTDLTLASKHHSYSYFPRQRAKWQCAEKSVMQIDVCVCVCAGAVFLFLVPWIVRAGYHHPIRTPSEIPHSFRMRGKESPVPMDVSVGEVIRSICDVSTHRARARQLVMGSISHAYTYLEWMSM